MTRYRRSVKGLRWALTVFTLALLAAACGASRSSSSTVAGPTRTLRGEFTLVDNSGDAERVLIATLPDGTCVGARGDTFSAYVAGARVAVKGAHGRLLGTGALARGTASKGPEGKMCSMKYKVTNLPTDTGELESSLEGGSGYFVDVAGQGGDFYPLAVLEKSGWLARASVSIQSLHAPAGS
jgi:hypothetical protein